MGNFSFFLNNLSDNRARNQAIFNMHDWQFPHHCMYSTIISGDILWYVFTVYNYNYHYVHTWCVLTSRHYSAAYNNRLKDVLIHY